MAAYATHMELLADGSILVLGRPSANDQDPRSAILVRLRPDGDDDLSFGDTICAKPYPRCGFSYSPPQLMNYLMPAAVAIDPTSQRIIVAGSLNEGTLHAMPILAFDADGMFDQVLYTVTFSTLGFDGRHTATDVEVSAQDGSIFLSSHVEIEGVPDSRIVAVGKLKADGTLDGGFGTGGLFVRSGYPDEESYSPSAFLQSDGRLVLAFNNQGNDAAKIECRAFRLDGTSGLIDATFGVGGTAPLEAVNAQSAYCFGTNTVANGKHVVIAGIFDPIQAEIGRTPFLFRLDRDILLRDGFGD